ncbi:precorrin-3B C(17)-methyltransferase [Allorhizocola rhizosphaerae]|uniref:precorrin-3B C(17)-methyltransferase n=1 Tax=Allorhizocola rhizosphaerae TaxID=1872709 RepID=UPI000E3C4747|nr:precorrin-3B C(17)-methyltransferase [Allorhizocola rhizosphaerae]
MALGLAEAWPRECTVHDGPVREQLAHAWEECTSIVAFLATGATVRLVAPLLSGKQSDPAVVCVDEAGRYAVALLGGHEAGANRLAERVSEVLGAQAVVTTATDSVGFPGLDMMGFKVGNPERLAGVSRAMLDGALVAWKSDDQWPVPALPPNVGDHPAAPHAVVITDRCVRSPQASDLDVAASGALVLHPPSLVLGIGASRGVAKGEIAALVDQVLADARLAAESVRCIATADIKADEAGLVEFGEERGWPILTYSAAQLAAIEVPHPSEVVREAVGTPSVSEAAALLAARSRGREARLIVPKTVSARATVAVARLVPRGRLAVVGLGPGAADLRTPRATTELRRAAIVVGLDQYVDQIRHLLRPGTRVVASGLGAEEERARTAVELARQGNAVALIGSGDAGVYAMASPALEFASGDLDIHMVPGVTAALAASALLGAPLGHDHAYISLSDLHTPWHAIERRLYAAAESDLVVCLYNPRSTRRTHQLPEALAILGKHRPPDTPVGIVRNAFRDAQRIIRTTLSALDPDDVDMNTVVIVGSSSTREVNGRMVTPRGYQWKQ